MSAKQEIELFISEDGELKVHIKGIKGPLCLKTLEALVGSLGSEKGRTLTSEYYERATGAQTTKIKKA